MYYKIKYQGVAFVECENDKCPVAKMKAENKRLKKRVDALKLELSYRPNPFAVGDRHEMGG